MSKSKESSRDNPETIGSPITLYPTVTKQTGNLAEIKLSENKT